MLSKLLRNVMSKNSEKCQNKSKKTFTNTRKSLSKVYAHSARPCKSPIRPHSKIPRLVTNRSHLLRELAKYRRAYDEFVGAQKPKQRSRSSSAAGVFRRQRSSSRTSGRSRTRMIKPTTYTQLYQHKVRYERSPSRQRLTSASQTPRPQVADLAISARKKSNNADPPCTHRECPTSKPCSESFATHSKDSNAQNISVDKKSSHPPREIHVHLPRDSQLPVSFSRCPSSDDHSRHESTSQPSHRGLPLSRKKHKRACISGKTPENAPSSKIDSMVSQMDSNWPSHVNANNNLYNDPVIGRYDPPREATGIQEFVLNTPRTPPSSPVGFCHDTSRQYSDKIGQITAQVNKSKSSNNYVSPRFHNCNAMVSENESSPHKSQFRCLHKQALGTATHFDLPTTQTERLENESEHFRNTLGDGHGLRYSELFDGLNYIVDTGNPMQSNRANVSIVNKDLSDLPKCEACRGRAVYNRLVPLEMDGKAHKFSQINDNITTCASYDRCVLHRKGEADSSGQYAGLMEKNTPYKLSWAFDQNTRPNVAPLVDFYKPFPSSILRNSKERERRFEPFPDEMPPYQTSDTGEGGLAGPVHTVKFAEPISKVSEPPQRVIDSVRTSWNELDSNTHISTIVPPKRRPVSDNSPEQDSWENSRRVLHLHSGHRHPDDENCISSSRCATARPRVRYSGADSLASGRQYDQTDSARIADPPPSPSRMRTARQQRALVNCHCPLRRGDDSGCETSCDLDIESNAC
ncbi:hypothetical protein EGW08_001121 [Elysia chlorotica]|uniref:Uncharacterized protein n=1 Tax=Elysia chlorotica TaxID=188477 RepID=A0A433UBD2_ELYCH|nr:hypothetical protein EGW08_001121 [Elysia chlorotica]